MTPTKNRKVKRGLNGNYGRELMELHTLGVNGGYRSTTSRKWRVVLQADDSGSARGGAFFTTTICDKGERWCSAT
jgi:hypothetical protein